MVAFGFHLWLAPPASGVPGTLSLASLHDKQAQLVPGPQSSPEFPEYGLPLYTVVESVLIPPESSPSPSGVVRGPAF